jgi:hypothetical protein
MNVSCDTTLVAEKPARVAAVCVALDRARPTFCVSPLPLLRLPFYRSATVTNLRRCTGLRLRVELPRDIDQ